MINISKPFLPPIEEYNAYLAGIYQRGWLTNNGPLVNEFELRLKDYLQVPHVLYLSNGTSALQLAIKALELTGEIITTPFSFVATTSAIVWQDCKPVFADINPKTLNIDPEYIEALITPQTSAILATHVFGNPCDIERIEAIAQKHNLKVIYDATHCFGTIHKGKSVFLYGDASITSFHATKLFHTIEGGGIFTASANLLKKIAQMRNFGYVDHDQFGEVGINAKNSEVHAAMGLCNFKYVGELLSKRKEQWLFYREQLQTLQVQFLEIFAEEGFNYSYFPIIFPDEAMLIRCMEALKLQYVSARRYFYPSLNSLDYVINQPCPYSENISKRILCLPLFHDLRKEEQMMIVRILLRVQNN